MPGETRLRSRHPCDWMLQNQSVLPENTKRFTTFGCASFRTLNVIFEQQFIASVGVGEPLRGSTFFIYFRSGKSKNPINSTSAKQRRFHIRHFFDRLEPTTWSDWTTVCVCSASHVQQFGNKLPIFLFSSATKYKIITQALVYSGSARAYRLRPQSHRIEFNRIPNKHRNLTWHGCR